MEFENLPFSTIVENHKIEYFLFYGVCLLHNNNNIIFVYYYLDLIFMINNYNIFVPLITLEICIIESDIYSTIYKNIRIYI